MVSAQDVNKYTALVLILLQIFERLSGDAKSDALEVIARHGTTLDELITEDVAAQLEALAEGREILKNLKASS